MWWMDPQGLLGPLHQDDDVKGGEPMTRGSSYLVDLQTAWSCVDPYLTWGVVGKEPGGLWELGPLVTVLSLHVSCVLLWLARKQP